MGRRGALLGDVPGTGVTRAIVLWCPDWPVTVAAQSEGIDPAAPLALIDRGVVFACSAAARQEGVQRGLRLREAQARSMDLTVLPYDPGLDARAFEPVLAAIEEIMPGVQQLRPGTCVIRARGPSRYYGGEDRAAAALIRCCEDLGISGVRVGIADGPFTAEQAARGVTAGGPDDRARADGIRIVPAGGSPEFLAPLSIGLLEQPQLATLLRRLGIQTLGAFAALDAVDVRERFGESGARAHAVASGLERTTILPRTPPKQLDSAVVFEPPLDRIDQVTFAFRQTADIFLAVLTRAGLVCTAIRVEVEAESGQRSERVWLHPRLFTAADVVDRVRWQLQGSGSVESGLTSPITRVRVVPESVDDIAHHEEGLWGGGPDERIHHGLSLVQSMLGREGVLTAAVGGGRILTERRVLVPWGERLDGAAVAEPPWPGSLPAPAPTTVFQTPRAVTVLTASGEPITVDERGMLVGTPERFSPASPAAELHGVAAWAGPWPLRERWWDAAESHALHRFQLVDADGGAWLLVLDGSRWWAEARYD